MGYVEDDTETDVVVLLLPRYSKRSLFSEYILSEDDEKSHCYRKTFTDVLHKCMPHVIVSIRARGICDKCIIFRE